jgi:hypothetical protein
MEKKTVSQACDPATLEAQETGGLKARATSLGNLVGPCPKVQIIK